MCEYVIQHAEAAGFDTMLLTVDIPVRTRRERELAVGLSLPPNMDISNVIQMMLRPRWALATLAHEVPKFHILDRYMPNNLGRQGAVYYVKELIKGHQSLDQLKELRERWKGKLLIKGLLSTPDIARAKELGYDGVVVSNHGGRQLESGPSAVDVLSGLRQEFPDYTLLADGGVCSGADHVMSLLQQELVNTMGQLGISELSGLKDCLYDPTLR
ncbi:MAG: alpha-hydroxy-acid oxidizing protein [Alphaproteobacteria bacterium]|nr:alpha-hydroxy-acid oxidizing protein [Alphaproteobacteria bacterium]